MFYFSTPSSPSTNAIISQNRTWPCHSILLQHKGITGRQLQEHSNPLSTFHSSIHNHCCKQQCQVLLPFLRTTSKSWHYSHSTVWTLILAILPNITNTFIYAGHICTWVKLIESTGYGFTIFLGLTLLFVDFWPICTMFINICTFLAFIQLRTYLNTLTHFWHRCE